MFNSEGKKYRLAGYIYLVTFAILVINWHSKPEYIAPAYIIIFAGAGLFIERLINVKKIIWLKYTVAVLLIVTGIISLPFAIPILPVEKYIAYAEFMGLKPTTAENKKLCELPQFYADMFGWEDMARAVSGVYKTITEKQNKEIIVVAWNYGDAGSVEYFNNKYILPKVISPHNNYWLWGKNYLNNYSSGPDIVIVLGSSKEDLSRVFESVEQASVFKSRYVMPYENNIPIFICSKSKVSLEKIWGKLKNYS